MRFFSLVIIILSPLISHSLTVTGHNLGTKASNHSLTENLLEIWGSTSGTCTPGQDSNGNDNVCNSCASGGETPCNRKKISINSDISIQFTYSNDINPSVPFIRDNDNNSVGSSSGSIANGVATITFKWGNLCDEIEATSSCTEIKSGDFTIGVEDTADNTKSDTMTVRVYSIPIDAASYSSNCSGVDPVVNVGIQDFSAYPGDEKVFFPGSEDADRISPILTFCEATGVSSGGSAPAGGEITSLVAFYSTTNLADVDTASESQTISFVGTFPDNVDISESFIDGFDNEVPVFTRLAVQDRAGNIFDLSPTNAEISTLGVGPCSRAADGTFSSSDILDCKYSTYPLEVLGLLTDDFNCFIATATFGSSMHFLVNDLRKFRNKFLLTNQVGQWLTKKYYKWGSRASHFIIEYPSLKFASKVILIPVWLFALSSLHIGLIASFLLLLLFIVSMSLLSFSIYNRLRTS